MLLLNGACPVRNQISSRKIRIKQQELIDLETGSYCKGCVAWGFPWEEVGHHVKLLEHSRPGSFAKWTLTLCLQKSIGRNFEKPFLLNKYIVAKEISQCKISSNKLYYSSNLSRLNFIFLKNFINLKESYTCPFFPFSEHAQMHSCMQIPTWLLDLLSH